MSRFIAIYCCLLTLAFFAWPALAQTPEAVGVSDPYIIKESKPRTPGPLPVGLDVIKYGEDMMKEQEEKVTATMTRGAEESVYFQRGIALDFLNKPIKLFELTCSAQDGSGSMQVQLPSVIKYAIKQWRNFCKSAAKSGGFKAAVKCAADQIWQAASEAAVREFQKFMETGFCRAFTDLINSQVSQCITLRFNTPRGNMSGYPALGQCAFGRIGLTVGIDSTGKASVKAQGQVISDVVSVNSFEYSKINGEASTDGFAGKEDQLLGDDGASALLDMARWKGPTSGAVAGATCGRLDPNLIAAFGEFYNRGDGLPANSAMYLNPGNEAVRGWKPDSSKPGGADWRTIANWSDKTKDPNGNAIITFVPATASDAVTSWSVKPQYTYIAMCYGFEMYPAPAICGTPGTSKAWNEQNCTNLDSEYICCDPDKTDCLGSGIVYAADTCSDGSEPKHLMVNGKEGPAYCGLDPSIKLHKAGEVSLCAGTCCNPALNDCAAIGSEICEAYKTVAQCVTASPDQLAMFDPVYSKLRAKPNMYMTGPGGGKLCCATEWCNLCPQDLIVAANSSSGHDPGRFDLYIKNSDLANVPSYCRSPRSQGGNIMNDLGGTANNENGKVIFDSTGLGLISVDDPVFENTQEACALMKLEKDPWDYNKIKHIFLECPQKVQENKVSSKFFNPAGSILGPAAQITDWAIETVTGTKDCPENTEAKPFIEQVVKLGPNGCLLLADITRYPMPITKIPRVEGQEPIGLCSELEICTGSIADEENPYSLLKDPSKIVKKIDTKSLIDAAKDMNNNSRNQTGGNGNLNNLNLGTGGGGDTGGSGDTGGTGGLGDNLNKSNIPDGAIKNPLNGVKIPDTGLTQNKNLTPADDIGDKLNNGTGKKFELPAGQLY